MFGQLVMLAGSALIISTIKRPVWLGGMERRYTSDDTANAMLTRAWRRSTGGYIMLAGWLMWLSGI